MSGLGTRFYDSEFDRPKPFIEVNGKEMYLRAAHNCGGDRFIFVVQKKTPLSLVCKRKYSLSLAHQLLLN